VKIVEAMQKVESGGDFNVKGKSGERGSLQWMEGTYEAVSRQMTGETLAFTPINEKYVASLKVQKLLDQGKAKDAEEVARIWNTSLMGQEKPLVKKGVNKWGVAYDSLAHGLKVKTVYANSGM
jgi:hypothetical protein